MYLSNCCVYKPDKCSDRLTIKTLTLTHKQKIIMSPIENNETLLLFFHGLDSSCETNKYTCIEHRPKYCQTVNYREDFEGVFEIYDTLVQQKLREYPRVVLAGHSLGGWFANHFAHKYGLRALLIAPCINPSVVLFGRTPIAGEADLPFPTSNSQMTKVMIEVDDESLEVATARQTLIDLPKSWEVEYFEGGHHRIARESEIWDYVNSLCNDLI